MIEQVKAYKYGNQVYPSIRDAQFAALELIFSALDEVNPANSSHSSTAANLALEKRDEIVGILSLEGEPQPKPRKTRKDKGTKRAERFAVNPELIEVTTKQ